MVNRPNEGQGFPVAVGDLRLPAQRSFHCRQGKLQVQGLIEFPSDDVPRIPVQNGPRDPSVRAEFGGEAVISCCIRLGGSV